MRATGFVVVAVLVSLTGCQSASRRYLTHAHRPPDVLQGLAPAARLELRDAYDRAFGPMIAAIRCCVKTPNAVGCRTRAIGPTEADVKLDERGRLSSYAWVRGSDVSVPACVPNR
jgi:hypothetical protein